MKHEEADLQRAFCKKIKKLYPDDSFLRHEREGKRTPFMQNLFNDMNHGIDKLPDFEGLITNEAYTGFYIEFKKPGEKWLLKDGITVKPQYANQYRCHLLLRSMGRAVWFCNHIEIGLMLYEGFKNNLTYPLQDYLLPVGDAEKNALIADDFFEGRGIK